MTGLAKSCGLLKRAPGSNLCDGAECAWRELLRASIGWWGVSRGLAGRGVCGDGVVRRSDPVSRWISGFPPSL